MHFFFPWAAVHGNSWYYEDCFSTFPMATNISPRWGFLFVDLLLQSAISAGENKTCYSLLPR
jgi:hypothetical protein